MAIENRFQSCRLLHLSPDALGDIGVRNVVYLVRARVENAQQIAQQIKATHRYASPLLLLMGPQKLAMWHQWQPSRSDVRIRNYCTATVAP